MIFKVVGGAAPPSIDQLWYSSDALAEDIDAALDTSSTYQGHYKNRIVQDWQIFNPREVSSGEKQNQTLILPMQNIWQARQYALEFKYWSTYKKDTMTTKMFGANDMLPHTLPCLLSFELRNYNASKII